MKKLVVSRWPTSVPGVITTMVLALIAYTAVSVVSAVFTHDIVVASMIANAAAVVAFLILARPDTPLAAVRPAQAVSGHMVAMIAVCVVISWLFGHTTANWLNLTVGSQNFQAHQQSLSQYSVGAVLLAQILFSPLGEEALMRGIIYPLYRSTFGVLNAVLTTSAIFALLHGNLVQIALTFPLGVVLALVYEVTGRISVVMAIHMLFNAVSLMVPATALAPWSNPLGVVGLGAATVLTVAGLYQLVRRGSAEKPT